MYIQIIPATGYVANFTPTAHWDGTVPVAAWALKLDGEVVPLALQNGILNDPRNHSNFVSITEK